MTSELSGVNALNFLLLAVIRGSTPLGCFIAVTRLNSASLVVTLKCAMSFVLFAITTVALLSSGKDDIRQQLKRNFRQKSTYWKVFLLGILQGSAPFLLAVFSLQYLPPTLMAVFMTATPWLTILFERLPFIKVRSSLTSIIFLGMILGFTGLLLIVSPVLHESVVNCRGKHKLVTNVSSTVSPQPVTHPAKARTYSSDFPYDVCLPPKDVVFGTFALIGAAILWAASSLFWRINRDDIHFSVASLGQNFVGGLVCFILWISFEKGHVVGKVMWASKSGIVAIVFLGICSGWLATHLVQLLSQKIGPKPTNQVLVALPLIAFVEDCIFVKDVITIHPWIIAMEVIGLLLLSLGTFMTNLPLGSKKKKGHGPLTDELLQTQFTEGVSDYIHSDYEPEDNKYQPLEESDHGSIGSRDEDEEEINTRKGSQSEPGLKSCSGSNVY